MWDSGASHIVCGDTLYGHHDLIIHTVDMVDTPPVKRPKYSLKSLSHQQSWLHKMDNDSIITLSRAEASKMIIIFIISSISVLIHSTIQILVYYYCVSFTFFDKVTVLI